MPRARPYIDLPPPTPEETLLWMSRLALRAQSSLEIRELAASIVQEIWPKDYVSEYTAILNWVRRNIRYVRDPVTMEQVQSPSATLAMRSGDCDDMSVLIAALVGHVGGQSRFAAGGFNRGPDGRVVLSHVWTEALDPASGKWIVLDPVPGRNVHSMLGTTVGRITHPGVG